MTRPISAATTAAIAAALLPGERLTPRQIADRLKIYSTGTVRAVLRALALGGHAEVEDDLSNPSFMAKRYRLVAAKPFGAAGLAGP